MKNCCFLVLLYFSTLQLLSQNDIEIGYLFCGNASIGKIIPNQQLSGTTYELPFSINAISNRLEVSWNTGNKSQFYVSAEYGDMGHRWKYYSYPDKYAHNNQMLKVFLHTPLFLDTFYIDARSLFAYQGYEVLKIKTYKASLTHKYTWIQHSKLKHKSILGLGFMMVTNKNSKSISFQGEFLGDKQKNENSMYFGEHIYWIEGLDTVKNYSRTSREGYQFYDKNPWTILLSLGYELSYQLSKLIAINAQVTYNQSLRPMMRWSQISTYSESATGYSEKNIQWFSSKLSHISFSLGISYKFGKDITP